MDVLTATGEIITASRDEHTDLFRAFPNSYGTLGYSVRLRIELEPVLPFVALRHVRFDRLVDPSRPWETSPRPAPTTGWLWTTSMAWCSAPTRGICLGTRTAAPGPVSDYTGQNIYHRSIRHADGMTEDRLTIHDYLWRWDTDWFWCSRAFGAQNPRIRRLWPRRYRRSSVYWKLIAYDQRFGIADRIEAVHGRPARERVVQDVEVPIENCAEFLDWFTAEVPIEPVWLCPLRLRDPVGWPLYPLRAGHTYVNVGFWSSVPAGPDPGSTNRLIEQRVSGLDGHKSLYSDAFYGREGV